jgi:hypothetical protein
VYCAHIQILVCAANLNLQELAKQRFLVTTSNMDLYRNRTAIVLQLYRNCTAMQSQELAK